MSKLSFIAFCIESYADHIQKSGHEVYHLFKTEGILKLLEDDYDDLHGMSIEYLISFFDEYLGGNK